MQVTISDQHVEITDSLRNYVGQKPSRIDRYFSPLMRSYVMLYATRIRYRVETKILTKGAQWHATAED